MRTEQDRLSAAFLVLMLIFGICGGALAAEPNNGQVGETPSSVKEEPELELLPDPGLSGPLPGPLYKPPGNADSEPMMLELSDIADWPMGYEGNSRRERVAIAAITAAGGEVRRRTSLFGEPNEGISVTMSSTSLDADLVHLTDISDLKQLVLSDCYQLTDNGMKSVGCLTGLETLRVDCTDFSDVGWSHLKHLRSLQDLSLGDTFISDRGMRFVGQLTRLQRLKLFYTQIGDVGLVHLKKLTDLRNLDLCHTNVTDEGLRRLAHLEKLESLTLSDTQITGTELHQLGRLSQLKRLDLARTPVDNEGIANLRGLGKLWFLSLQQTQVSNTGIRRLAMLRGLKEVRAMNTDVTQWGHDALKQELPEVEVSFGQTERYPNEVMARKVGYHPDEKESVMQLKRFHAKVTIGQDRRVWWIEAIGTRFSDEHVPLLRPLIKLNRLELTTCRRFTDNGLEALRDLPSLRQVFVQGSGVTRDGFFRAQRALPKTHFFY